MLLFDISTFAFDLFSIAFILHRYQRDVRRDKKEELLQFLESDEARKVIFEHIERGNGELIEILKYYFNTQEFYDAVQRAVENSSISRKLDELTLALCYSLDTLRSTGLCRHTRP